MMSWVKVAENSRVCLFSFCGVARTMRFTCGNKAHVQHTIALIQHQDFHVIQVQIAATHEVQQAPRSGHHQIHHMIGEAIELLLVVHAADQCGDFQARCTWPALRHLRRFA